MRTATSSTVEKHKALPEYHILHVKRVLNDSRGRHSDPQDILLRWQVRVRSNSLQIVQIAAGATR